MGKDLKILITGSKGFIGRNLVTELRNRGFYNLFEFDTESDFNHLDDFCKTADFIFHLAGVNRPLKNTEFKKSNIDLTSKLTRILSRHKNSCPILLSSSTQAELSNPYGQSKKESEELLRKHSDIMSSKIFIYRFPNIFGKWSKPNYNSVISTYCYNRSRNLPIIIDNPLHIMNIVYIDDVIDLMICSINNVENIQKTDYDIQNIYKISLGEIASIIESFKDSRKTLSVPNMSNTVVKNLYSTYLSYLPETEFRFNLNMHQSDTSSFTEFIKTSDRGQLSINIIKTGITKGNHWHQSKNEKFLVVSGEGIIKLRKVNYSKVQNYYVSSKKLEVVEIPPGYTHNIKNIGETDMVIIIWVNEIFNPDFPDTYHLEV